MIDPKKIIHGGPCVDCTAKLGRLEPHAAVLLEHEDCQAILTQGLRIIATHADHTFSIAGAVLRTRSAEQDARLAGPQVINDTCAHCLHPSESHEAGHGKCFKCDALNRCARFVAHDFGEPQ